MYEHTYKNVLLIGTSHIAQKSADKIKTTFKEYEPDVICVELDHKRLHGLLTNAKPNYSLSCIKQYGLQGYLFAVIGGFIQKKLGNVVGTKPGTDMLTAVKLANQNNKKLELIDQDIDVTLKKFSKKFSFKEKIHLVWDILSTPFADKNKRIKISLTDVPNQEIISQLMLQMKSRYPNLYYVLVEERNQIMARNIYKIMSRPENESKRILVVVGAGHEKDMLKLIKQEDFKRDKVR